MLFHYSKELDDPLNHLNTHRCFFENNGPNIGLELEEPSKIKNNKIKNQFIYIYEEHNLSINRIRLKRNKSNLCIRDTFNIFKSIFKINVMILGLIGEE